MPDRFKYDYAIIRLVPKVEREEFFNIGAILFSKEKKFLDVMYHIDDNKLKSFSNDIEGAWIHHYLKSWKLICKGMPYGGAIGTMDLPDRFRWLTASRSTIIQSSETHTGLCLDPEMALKDIFENYVL